LGVTTLPISAALRAYLDVQYELLRVLGTGGMGVVLLARERALERMVAIKVLRADIASDAESRERFRREARTAARLTHPHIVPLHTFGDVGGELYFVMGYIEGETLATRLAREERFSTEEAARVLAEIADALDYAHRAGTVHRDLKPENILLEAASGRALLTDFGIARDIGTGPSLTSTGVIVGTPHYMSPEQAAGDKAIDGRSDIYSLGVIGYRMVSGTLPFGGSNVREVVAKQMTAMAAPLPVAVQEESPVLVAAISRAMAKSPDARWSHASAMAASLRATDDDNHDDPAMERTDAIVAKVAVLSTVGGAVIPLWNLLGFSTTPLYQDSLAWLVVAVMGPVAALIGVGAGAMTGDPATRQLRWRVALRPPRWWSVWWPKRFRRPSDVWSRLPVEMRAVRWLNAVSLGVMLPMLVGAFAWAFSPTGSLELVEVMRERPQLLKWVVGIGLTTSLAFVGAAAYLARRVQRRVGFEWLQVQPMFQLPNADPHWRLPRYAELLAQTVARAPRPQQHTTEDLLRDLERVGVQLPEGLSEARAGAIAAVESLDRELRALREMVNADEVARLDARLAQLGDRDSALRAMLESQRAILVRAEARIVALGGVRARLDAQQHLLHQQLIALRELAPRGGDTGDVTGKLRELNADLRRLVEAYSTL
jgi:predicted Ser/Thr protein kinase